MIQSSKQKYGMIPFFIPHLGCPHICVFCNQTRIAGNNDSSCNEENTKESIQMPAGLSRHEMAHTIRSYVGDNRSNKLWEVAFYGGSFSAISPILQAELLAEAKTALDEGLIDGIRCSTRPDALSDDQIDFLYENGIRTVEIGVQSMNDDILKASKRGHTAQDVHDAVNRLRNKGINIGLQLLPGLPGETIHTIVQTAVDISKLKPDFVRIYPVLVIENTELATMYRQGAYNPLTVEQAVKYSAFMKTWFENHHIEVIRTGLQSTEELDSGTALVAGPYEPAMGEMVVNQQWRERIEACFVEHIQCNRLQRNSIPKDRFTRNSRVKGISTLLTRDEHSHSRPLTSDEHSNEEGLLCKIRASRKQEVIITYSQSMTSKIRGVHQCNMKYFNEVYPYIHWCWQVRKSEFTNGIQDRLVVNNQSVTIDIDGIHYML